MIDLDPQANLTLSFYTGAEWQDDLRENLTIKSWFDADLPGQKISLPELVLTPPRVNEHLADSGGRLDLIASHLGLIDIDLQLGAILNSHHDFDSSTRRYLQVHDCLAEALRAPAFREYDLIMIDCPPNFGLVTKTAIVASDHVLVPAKPDYLSTLGIAYMVSSLQKLVNNFNKHATHQSDAGNHRRSISPQIAGVVFTMTQHQIGQPVTAQRNQMEQVRAQNLARVLDTSVRNGPTFFADAGESGVPAVLRGSPSNPSTVELKALTEEFIASLAEKGQSR